MHATTVLYKSGQLVKHKRYGYRGVIVAVDHECLADESWYETNQTQPDRKQPWYHVFVSGSDQITYPAQSSLIPDESCGKYGVDIIIGQNTYETVNDFAALELDLTRVKGKVEPVRIFGLLGDQDIHHDPKFQELKTSHEDFLRAYRAQDWSLARKKNGSMHSIGFRISPARITLSPLSRSNRRT